MRRLEILHRTYYNFSKSVRLGPHRLLLRPREGADLRIESSGLVIEPAHRVTWHRDVFDNAVATVEFSAPAARLAITSEIVVQHFVEEPLDFVVEEAAVSYPFLYAAEDRLILAPFQRPVYAEAAADVRRWLDALDVGEERVETYALLDRLNRGIHRDFAYAAREQPGVQSPAETLASRTGSCRDFATLFIEACRNIGLASRFVSGYLNQRAAIPVPGATHAWAEVYLPGPGWKGFDPTTGEVAGNDNIAVAVSRHPQEVPPVAGSFVGFPNQAPALFVDVQVESI